AQSKEPATVTPSPAAPVDGQAASAKAEGTGDQRVAILRLRFSGDVPEASREHFLSRMVEGLAVARFQVVSGATVQDRLASQSGKRAACADGGCYPNVAELLQVGFLVTGVVEEANKNYDIEIEMINGRTGATIGKSHERCETCGIAEAAEKMSLATS